MSNIIETRLIKRNTRAKNMYCYITKMIDTAEDLNIKAKVYPTNITNYILTVEVDIEAIITGEVEQLDLFEKLIDPKDSK